MSRTIPVAREVDRIVAAGVACRRCKTLCECLSPIGRSLTQVILGIQLRARCNVPLQYAVPTIIRQTLDAFAFEYLYHKDLQERLETLANEIITEESMLD